MYTLLFLFYCKLSFEEKVCLQPRSLALVHHFLKLFSYSKRVLQPYEVTLSNL